MKKLILLLIIMTSLNVFSQTGPIIGIGGSYNSTWIFFPNAYGNVAFDNTKPKNYIPSYGYDDMLKVGWNFKEGFGIRAEIGNSVQNQKFQNKNPKIYSTRDVQMNYTQIPVMLFFSSKRKNIAVHFMFGPQIGTLKSAAQTNITAKWDTTKHTLSKQIAFNYDKFKQQNITDRYNKTDILVVFDFGFDIYITHRLFLSLGLRIHGSLRDINKSDWQDLPDPIHGVSNLDYFASRNIYGGVNASLNYALTKWHK